MPLIKRPTVVRSDHEEIANESLLSQILLQLRLLNEYMSINVGEVISTIDLEEMD